MAKIERMFSTSAEACAFIEGVELANDSDLEVVSYEQQYNGMWQVVLEDSSCDDDD